MNKSRTFFILSLGLIMGVGAASFLHPVYFRNSDLLLGAAFSLIFPLAFFGNRKALVAGLFFLVFFLGAWFTGLRLDRLAGLPDRQEFSGTARVIKDREIRNGRQRLVVEGIDKNNLFGRFLISTGPYPEYGYGDELKVSCSLEVPQNKEDSTFDYRMYLAKEGIGYLCQRPKIESVSNGGGNMLYRQVLQMKNKLVEIISRGLPNPESGLLVGILLGGSNQLSEGVQDGFSRTGLTHIVAVSGYNVTIVAEYLMLFGIWIGLWRKQAFWFAIAGIAVFVILVGLPSSAVRAGIMGGLLIWAMKNGRLAHSGNAIIFSAVIMLAINPLLLRWDIGFQLSFLATLGVVYIYPLCEVYLIKKNRFAGFWEILLMTLSAQVFVLPVILYNFNQLSLASPLANILALPAIPLTMLLGFLAVFLGLVFPFLSVPFFWLAYIPLHYEIEIVNYLSGLRFATIEIGFPAWGMAVWYLSLGGVLYLFKTRSDIHAKT